MTDYLDNEAESDNSENEDLDVHDRRKLKKLRAISDSEEDEDDDEDDVVNDLIDDNPIDDDASDDEPDTDDDDDKRKHHGNEKRRKKTSSDDERLEDDDFELLEENLGVKFNRNKRFKRVRRNDDSDGEDELDESMEREQIANQLFDGDNREDDAYDDDDGNRRPGKRRSGESRDSRQTDEFDLSGSRRNLANDSYGDADEDDESDADDFIVDDEGRPITQKKKRVRRIFNDAHLQEGQDIFGVDFDYDEFDKYEEEEDEDAEDEDEESYEDEDGNRVRHPRPATKKRPAKKTIFEIYEPSELKRGHFTDMDNEIRRTDVPERMQMREVPFTPIDKDSQEMKDEADWIYKHAFKKPFISKQKRMTEAMPFDVFATENCNIDYLNGSASTDNPAHITKCILETLDFLRNRALDVPFIAFYRKDHIRPLTVSDVWTIFEFDGKWCQLVARRKTLTAMMAKMRQFQQNTIMADPDQPLPDDVRIIRDEDIKRMETLQTPEELRDAHAHFLMHYGHQIAAMNAAQKRIERLERQRLNGDDSDEPLPGDGGAPDAQTDRVESEYVKKVHESGPYAMCRKANLLGIAKRFGLTPEHYADNLRNNYQRHEVEQERTELTELASEYVNARFSSVEEVLHAAKFVVARQLARDPELRRSVREVYYDRARLSVFPTKRGIKEIDETHPCYTMKYLRNKPVGSLQGDEFLRLCMAEEDKLLTIAISDHVEAAFSLDKNGQPVNGTATNNAYLDEAKALYQRDEFSKNVQEWNALRSSCVEIALNKMVLPDLRKELRSILLTEAKHSVMMECQAKMQKYLSVAPLACDGFADEDDYEWDTSRGLRIMAIAYVPDFAQAAFGVLCNADGEVTDYIRLPNLLKRRQSNRADEKRDKEADLGILRNFIRGKKPHAIVIGSESREALMIKQDVQEILRELADDEQFPGSAVRVEIADNDLSKIYAQSNRGVAEHREYPALLRQALSLARRARDPLVEFSQLCTADEEILCLRFHELQDQLPREKLLEHLYMEFVNRTNQVGVDLTAILQNPISINLVQFVCGFGPRKAQAMMKLLKQSGMRLENRTQLVTNFHFGPNMFINLGGFLRIDTSSLGDSTESYVEILDGSRVHPETYEWARKMASDALESVDDQLEDHMPNERIEEVINTPECLKELDLEAFATELERQGFGDNKFTLYDMRAELQCRFRDTRPPYESPTAEELFCLLTKETPATLYVGKMLLATVTGFTHRKPQPDQFENVTPARDGDTGLWQCPVCLVNDFADVSDVWNHFDTGECTGQATGIRVRLDNDLNGYIHIKNLSDKHVKNPEERVRIGQAIHVRVTKIEMERFQVDCTSKSSDLADRNNEWRPKRDEYYDYKREERESRVDDQAKKKSNAQYTKRIIVHPAFHNISFADAIKKLQSMEQGEAILRPSSKGSDHLTCTWNVAPNVFQHVDIREEGKENAFSLGQSLWIGNEEFEDLDEIIARYVNPMASLARDLIAHKCYRAVANGAKDILESLLRDEKAKNPSKIHYFLAASEHYAGKFLLSYLPTAKVRHEYLTVTPDGIRFRQQMFDSVNALLKWFKEHYRDPIPAATPLATPRGASSASSRMSYAATPAMSTHSGGAGQQQPHGKLAASDAAIHKVAASMPAHMLHQLSQAAASGAQHTPSSYVHTPGSQGGGSSVNAYNQYINTPYTPSGQTPFMTPYHTTPAHHGGSSGAQHHTPRYGTATPSGSGTFLQPGLPIGRSASASGAAQQYHPSPQSSYGRSPHMQQPSPRGPAGGHQHGGSAGGNARAHGGYNQRDQRGGSYDRQSNRSSGGGGGGRYGGNAPQVRSYDSARSFTSAAASGRVPEEENWDDAPSATPVTNSAASAPQATSRASGAGNGTAYKSKEAEDWDLAAESWATGGSKRTGETPRQVNGTPTQQTPRYGDGGKALSAAGTPAYDPTDRPMSRSSSIMGKSPRSARGTPHTNTSPRSMQLGDSTPLYDEN